jgi:hypothetical protein
VDSKWLVILEGELASGDVETMSATSDAVMEALLGFGAEDPNTSGNAATGHFEIEVTVAGRTEAEALSVGMRLIYTAIQMAGALEEGVHGPSVRTAELVPA